MGPEGVPGGLPPNPPKLVENGENRENWVFTEFGQFWGFGGYPQDTPGNGRKQGPPPYQRLINSNLGQKEDGQTRPWPEKALFWVIFGVPPKVALFDHFSMGHPKKSKFDQKNGISVMGLKLTISTILQKFDKILKMTISVHHIEKNLRVPVKKNIPAEKKYSK